MEEEFNTLKTESRLKSFLPVMKKVSMLLAHNEDNLKINDAVNTMIPIAQSVLRASEHLVSLANKSATEDTEDDVKMASEKMITGGRSILSAIQLLKAESGSKRSRENLANSTSKLLEAVVQVLGVLKSSRIQNILQSAEMVQQTLRNVCSVTDIKSLVPTFQEFTMAVLKFAGLCEKHKSGMNDSAQKEKLSAYLKSLKKLIPALKSVLQNQVKYPRNVHAKASCELIEKHVHLAVGGVVQVIQGQVEQKPYKEEEKEIQTEKKEDGHFASDVAMVVHLLSPRHRQSTGPDLQPLVSRLIRHSMMVAVTSREDLKAEITHISQEVLELLKQVTDRHTALKGNLNYSQLANDFNQSCEKLAREVVSLESFIRSAIIHQVVDVLVQTTEPMSRLVKAATIRVKDGGQMKDEDCLNVLQPLDDRLHDHMDRLCQVGSFVVAGCSDAEKIAKVEKSIEAIDELDPDILPSCLAVRRDSRNKAAMAHLQLVYQEWCQEVGSLVDGIFKTIDLHRFLEISEVCLESDLEDCRHAALIPDGDFLAESVNKMLGRTKQVLRVGKDIQNANEDPIYRNGVQVFLDQIENALPLVKNSAHYALKNVNNPRVQKQLKERAQHLIEAVHLLKEGIDAKNQPGLMSPLRENVRKAPTPASTTFEKNGDVPGFNSASLSREKRNLSASFRRTPSPGLTTSGSGDKVSLGETKKIGDKGSYQFDVMPQSKLQLVFPAGDVVRSVFKQDEEKLEEFLTQMKEKSTSLIGIAEAMSKLQSLESVRHTLPLAGLMAATEKVVSSSVKALSGDDVLQAECLIAADKWSSLYAEMEKKIIRSLHPDNGFFEFMTDMTDMAYPVDKLQKETGSLRHFQECVSKMVSTVLQRKDPEKVDALISAIEQHASEWNALTSDILKQASQLNLNLGNQSLKDRFSFGRMRWMVKLHGLLDSVVRHLNERQELWRDVIGGKKWKSSEELRDSISKMKTQTDVHIQLTDLVSLCVPSTNEVDKMIKVKGDLDKLSHTLLDYRGYSVSGEGSLHLESAVTYVGLLEWCAVMQHLCDYLDMLSADMGLRIDRLLSSAHAANSSSGPSKQHFLSELQGQSDALSLVVTQTRQLTVSAVMTAPSHTLKTTVLTSIDELSRLTPKLLSLTRDLADNKLHSNLSEVNHVKRSWLCHSLGIVGGLQKLPLIEEKKIQEIQRLLQGPGMLPSVHQFSVNDTSSSIPRAPQSAFIPVSQPHKTFTAQMYPHHLSPHPTAFSVDAGSLDVSVTHTPVDHIFSPHPSQHLHDPYRSHLLGGDPTVHTTGQARGLYTDSSYSWQGMEPRLVTSQTKAAQTQRSKPYRSRTLGLEELPVKSASTSSLPSATARPPLQRTDSMKCYSTIEATALMLQQEADKWEKDGNQYIEAIKQLSENMNILKKFAQRSHSDTPKPELVSAARAIATEACNIHRFAEIITRHAKDKKLAEELEIQCKQIPALATQLNIIATVKTATPEDYKSDVVIVTNAEKLLEAVMKTLSASETLCVKGLKIIEYPTPDEAAAASLAAQWKRKLYRHRQIEAASPDVDSLGLRRISKNISMPSLTEMFQRSLRT